MMFVYLVKYIQFLYFFGNHIKRLTIYYKMFLTDKKFNCLIVDSDERSMRIVENIIDSINSHKFIRFSKIVGHVKHETLDVYNERILFSNKRDTHDKFDVVHKGDVEIMSKLFCRKKGDHKVIVHDVSVTDKLADNYDFTHFYTKGYEDTTITCITYDKYFCNDWLGSFLGGSYVLLSKTDFQSLIKIYEFVKVKLTNQGCISDKTTLSFEEFVKYMNNLDDDEYLLLNNYDKTFRSIKIV